MGGTEQPASLAAVEHAHPLWRKLRKFGLSMLGAVATVYLSGLAGANTNWFPHFGSDPPTVYAAKTNYSSVQARIEARLTAPVRHTFAAGRPVEVIGFCIGAPTVDPAAHDELDQRWWVLRDGSLLPYPDASGEGASPPLRGCAHANDPIGGSQDIRLLPRVRHRVVMLSAAASEAVTIGFELFAARTSRWLPAALLHGDRPPVRVTLHTRQRVTEALAVVCWGPGGPAEHTKPTAPVIDLQPLGAESAVLQRTASRQSAAAAADICRRNRYGVFPEHPPPARPQRPATTSAPTTRVTPEVPVQTTTVQATTPPQESHTTKTVEPGVTIGPEEHSHVAHP